MIAQVEPLTNHLYKKAKGFGINTITLNFSKKCGEEYLNVNFGPKAKNTGEYDDFRGEVEHWAWHVYSFNPIGGEDDCGDNIVYNLVKNKVTVTEWYMIAQKDEPVEFDLKLN